MKQGLALLGLVLLTHYAYPVLADSAKQASWWFYVLRGLEGTALFVLLLSLSPKQRMAAIVWVFACFLGAFEEAQTAVCGYAAMGTEEEIPLWSGLCLEEFGYWPYAAIGASTMLYLWGIHDKGD